MTLHCAEQDGVITNPFYFIYFVGDKNNYILPEYNSKGIAVCRKHISNLVPEIPLNEMDLQNLEGMLFEGILTKGEVNIFGAVQAMDTFTPLDTHIFLNADMLRTMLPNTYQKLINKLLINKNHF